LGGVASPPPPHRPASAASPKPPAALSELGEGESGQGPTGADMLTSALAESTRAPTRGGLPRVGDEITDVCLPLHASVRGSTLEGQKRASTLARADAPKRGKPQARQKRVGREERSSADCRCLPAERPVASDSGRRAYGESRDSDHSDPRDLRSGQDGHPECRVAGAMQPSLMASPTCAQPFPSGGVVWRRAYARNAGGEQQRGGGWKR
jgi:hypothetical protein